MREFGFRRFMKAYSVIYAALFGSAVVFGSLDPEFPFDFPLDAIDILITVGMVVGLIAFSWGKKLQTRTFWQVLSVGALAWVVWYNGLHWTPEDLRQTEGSIWGYIAFVALIHVPVFLGLYKYAFMDDHPWSGPPPDFPSRDSIDDSIEATEGNYRDYIDFNEDRYIFKFNKYIRSGGGYEATWHWPAFFFGPLWFAYRRMYLWALLAAVVQTVPILGWIALGFSANYIYFKKVNKDIRWIRSKEDDELEVSQSLSRAGESSTSAVLVVVLIIVLIAVIPADF